jgi:hypothetical protein
MKIFICYRRKDTRHVADRIYQGLAAKFGPDSVFKDVNSVPLGNDFRRVIEEAVMQCDALLTVIGEQWLSITDEKGVRRLEDPNDYVRLEIETALSRGIPVIPVIADQATVPRPEELPVSIEQLAYRQSAVVRPDPDFDRDMDRLTDSLERLLRSAMRSQRGNAENEHGKTQKLRYYCYISRSKVEQLHEQLTQSNTEDRPPRHFPRELDEPRGSLNSFDSLRFGGRSRSDFVGIESVVSKLGTVLKHIESHEKTLDIARLCNEKGQVPLDAFSYTYHGRFFTLGNIGSNPDSGIYISGAALRRSRDDILLSKSLLIEPSRTENSIQESGPNNGRIVSEICIICSEIQDYTLRLACSYKFFSDMGGSWSDRSREWSVTPHSGNHHFFEGEVDAWFEAVLFVNGIRGNTILGTPLFLVHSFDPNLIL